MGTERSADAIDVVRAFFAAMAESGARGAEPYLADDIVFTNVSLPTARGKRSVLRALSALDRSPVRFSMQEKAIAATADTVLIERTDEVAVGRLRIRFWVWGHFEVSDGRITVWRDYFDWYDVARGIVVALVEPVTTRIRLRRRR